MPWKILSNIKYLFIVNILFSILMALHHSDWYAAHKQVTPTTTLRKYPVLTRGARLFYTSCTNTHFENWNYNGVEC